MLTVVGFFFLEAMYLLFTLGVSCVATSAKGQTSQRDNLQSDLLTPCRAAGSSVFVPCRERWGMGQALTNTPLKLLRSSFPMYGLVLSQLKRPSELMFMPDLSTLRSRIVNSSKKRH